MRPSAPRTTAPTPAERGWPRARERCPTASRSTPALATHTFTVTAIDNAGNTTTVTHSYRASICSRTGAHAVSCELWARAGTIDLPGMPNVPDQDLRRPQRCAGDHAGRRARPRRARRRHRQRPAAQRPERAARTRRAAAADGSCDLQDRTRRIGDVLLRRAHGHVDLRGRLGSERRGARRERRQAGGAGPLRRARRATCGADTPGLRHGRHGLRRGGAHAPLGHRPGAQRESRHVRHVDVRADLRAHQRPSLRRNGGRYAADRLGARPRRAATHRQRRR